GRTTVAAREPSSLHGHIRQSNAAGFKHPCEMAHVHDATTYGKEHTPCIIGDGRARQFGFDLAAAINQLLRWGRYPPKGPLPFKIEICAHSYTSWAESVDGNRAALPVFRTISKQFTIFMPAQACHGSSGRAPQHFRRVALGALQ